MLAGVQFQAWRENTDVLIAVNASSLYFDSLPVESPTVHDYPHRPILLHFTPSLPFVSTDKFFV